MNAQTFFTMFQPEPAPIARYVASPCLPFVHRANPVRSRDVDAMRNDAINDYIDSLDESAFPLLCAVDVETGTRNLDCFSFATDDSLTPE